MNTNVQTDRLHSLLFEEGRQLENFKFFPGTRAGVSPQELRDAAAIAVQSAFARGLQDNPPVSGREKTTI